MEILFVITGAILLGAGFAAGYFIGTKQTESIPATTRVVNKTAEKILQKLADKSEPLPRSDYDEYALEQQAKGAKPEPKQEGIYGIGE